VIVIVLSSREPEQQDGTASAAALAPTDRKQQGTIDAELKAEDLDGIWESLYARYSIDLAKRRVVWSGTAITWESYLIRIAPKGDGLVADLKVTDVGPGVPDAGYGAGERLYMLMSETQWENLRANSIFEKRKMRFRRVDGRLVVANWDNENGEWGKEHMLKPVRAGRSTEAALP